MAMCTWTLCVYCGMLPVDFQGSVDTLVRIDVHRMLHCGSGLASPFRSSECSHNQHFIIRPHPLDLGVLAPPLTSLMWLGVVSSMCHAPVWLYQNFYYNHVSTSAYQ